MRIANWYEFALPIDLDIWVDHLGRSTVVPFGHKLRGTNAGLPVQRIPADIGLTIGTQSFASQIDLCFGKNLIIGVVNQHLAQGDSTFTVILFEQWLTEDASLAK